MLTRPKLCNYFGDDLRFYAIHDPVADPGNKMAIWINSDILLITAGSDVK